MTDQQARTNGLIAVFAGALQIVFTLQVRFVTATEYDPAILVWMGLGLDALMAVFLGAMAVQFAAAPAGTPWRAIGLPMATLAAALSLVQLGIRFTSDDGWWTGRLTYAPT